MNRQSTDIAWVVATLAPWTISPHPNFSGGLDSPAQALALVTERRDQGRAESDEDSDARWSGWAAELIRAARSSLMTESQKEATASLWRLSALPEIPIGARVAAATYAALGSLELDEAFEAVDRLGALFSELGRGREPEECAPSLRLALGVLAQQLVVRAQDSFRLDEARAGIADVLRWLPNLDVTGFDDFQVSRGISWSSSRVQKDVLVATKQNALGSRAALEQFGGSTWVRIVRGRSGWIDLRHYLLERNRDAAVVRDEFETRFDSTSGKRIFGRESTTSTAYSALLAAELSGDHSRIKQSRAEMAKIHLLATGDESFHTREALRLLRQADATAPLKSALGWIRSEGPLQSLRDDAKMILQRSMRFGYASEADLLVLESSADLLSADELDQAIRVSKIFFETQERTDRISWSSYDKRWKAVSRFVPGSGSDSGVAQDALELVGDSQVLSRPLTNTLARLVSEIDWANVAPHTRDGWSDWLGAQPESDPETELLVEEVRASLGVQSAQLSRPSGLELAAALADDGLAEDDDESTLALATEIILEALQSQASAASTGRFAFGAIAPANVAAAFALRFDSESVWDALVDHLIDSNVLSEHKELALERLAANASAVPDAIRRRLAESWRIVADSPRDSWFGGESLPLSPQALRMAAAFDALTPTEGLEAVLKLAASNDSGKIEGARSIPYVARKGDATWAHVLLLQLSEDRNPNVRAEAGFSMIRLLDARSTVSQMISRRAEELLSSDGIRCALRILHGLQSISSSKPSVVERWLPTVRLIAESDSRRVVRGAASELLKMYARVTG